MLHITPTYYMYTVIVYFLQSNSRFKSIYLISSNIFQRYTMRNNKETKKGGNSSDILAYLHTIS